LLRNDFFLLYPRADAGMPCRIFYKTVKLVFFFEENVSKMSIMVRLV